MPRPFPFALGIGTDICKTARIYRIITNPGGAVQQFIRNFLNPTEIREHASKLKLAVELDTLKASGTLVSELRSKEVAAKAWSLAQFLGGRWAAKEAAIKAHTWRRISKHDITIIGGVQVEGRTMAPTMTIRAKNGGEDRVAKISISHDGEYATAVCLAAEEGEEPDAGSPSGDIDEIGAGLDALSLENAASSKEPKRSLSFSELLVGKR